jgi:L-lactate dehydrogenase (cytochrome)
VTLWENYRVFEAVTFRPRCAAATSACDSWTTVLSTTPELPFLLGPVGSCLMFYSRGKVVAPEADGAAARFTSTLS